MTLPTKPQVCVINGKLAVFMGADYKFLELGLRRELKRAQRAAAKATRA